MAKEVAAKLVEEPDHPMEDILRMDRIPHIWCSGCGIGMAVNCFAGAIREAGISYDDVSVVSGIGCTGRVAGYMKLDSFHTTHGRPIPFATGLKLANPNLKVVVVSGDGDIMAIGGNHLIHAARRNMDIVVICVNNFNYAMTGGQVAPTTPIEALATTSPYGCYEEPFNLPYIADSCGAVYVARWTVLHVRRLTESIKHAFNKKGFSFIEVIAPCVTLYLRKNKLGEGKDLLQFYHDNSEIKHGADTREVGLGFQSKIVVGNFVDRERPSFTEQMESMFDKKLGERHTPYKPCGCGGDD